ncbi:MAG TPA: peptidoglycan DD-metalloendopeptidase family protein [Arthrobacter sp.]|nr:peptidoglycan DD-metalloendopeptidase family protein [Arthrobacter sp.]
MLNTKDCPPQTLAGRLRLPGRNLRFYGTAAISTTAAAMMTLTLLSGLPAGADQLDDMKDQQAQLEQRIDQVQENLAHLDADIVETVAQLQEYKDRLPGAKKRLERAQAGVAKATREVEALAARVELAEQTKAKINEQLELDRAEIAKTEELIGQIATAAYKSGGMPSNLSLFFSAEGGNIADSIGMADQALRSQTAVLDKLAQQHATNVNTRARLADVEAEIKSLKKKADAALAREKDARDKAAAEKEKVDTLISETAALSDKLEAKKPKVEAKLSRIEQEHKQVQADIAEKQRQQRLAWERKQERLRKAAEARRQAQIEADRRAAAKANRPAPPPPAAAQAPSSNSGFGLRLPVGSGVPMTSGFGWRKTPSGTIDFLGRGGYMHTGLDFGASCGTPVYAPADGEVWYADSAIQSGGNRVVLTHGVVNGDALSTIYYHLQRSVVSPGQHVSKGQLIAYSGNTGNSTGCHLHFETILNGEAVNPLSVL